MAPHWIRVKESNSRDAWIGGSYKSKAEALRAGKEALAGCVRREGYVEIYDCNPREVHADPVKRLRA